VAGFPGIPSPRQAARGKLNYVGGLYYFKEAGYVHDFVPFESLLFVQTRPTT